ncbi:hypothetical protein THAOC_28677, partial [Thalassiosira oceanica]
MKIQLAVATAAALLLSVNAAVSPLANFAAETADVENVGERKRGHASKRGECVVSCWKFRIPVKPGPVYHEAPKGTAYPSYKDVLLSSRQVTDRKLTSSTSSRKDSSRNMAPGRSKRKRPRRKKRPRKQNVTQAERQQTLLLLYAMDDEEDIDAGDEDIADNREFGRSISKYIKAAGPPADQGD